MNENEILGYNIPTAVPLIMEFDEKLNLVNNFFLMDEAELKERMEAVANQGKAK
jgi:2,3-bisphosphoglycerate-dependent phosphoglycerate mutase